MGCIGSKHAVRSFNSPLRDSNSSAHFLGSSSSKNHDHDHDHNHDHPIQPLTKINKRKQVNDKINTNNVNHAVIDDHSNCDWFNLYSLRSSAAEHIAAGWPSFLTKFAGEALDGWLPLKSDSFHRLEKIGQGTYSNVYRARHIESGRMVALKKVHFDLLLPESIKFTSREITILRRLDHPNIIKLEGIITSESSENVYLVFEYMEHDLSGLLSCPDIKFSDSQIKCYMRQLLNGIEHCHSLGILHRDIKSANILVNNEGVLKIADFGLANFYFQAMTNHVVTLWYRPPELLLGCTKYGTYVDLWSIGCVFAELYLRRPILKARTEVEQLHKIFKLCGTPPEEYWNKSKLPFATMFKPHRNYESTLCERFKELPKTAVDLIATLLSVEPHKRGTARSALQSEHFTTKPFACDSTSLPRYPPNKEIDAKVRKEARRKKPGGINRSSGDLRNPRTVRTSCQEQTSFCKVVPTKVNPDDVNNSDGASSRAWHDAMSEFSQPLKGSETDHLCPLPTQPTASKGGVVRSGRRRRHGSNPTTSVCNGFRNRRVCGGSFDSTEVHKSRDLPNVPVIMIDSD